MKPAIVCVLLIVARIFAHQYDENRVLDLFKKAYYSYLLKDVELMKQKHPTNSNLLDMKEYLSELMSRSDVNSPSSGAELLKLKIYNTLNDPEISAEFSQKFREQTMKAAMFTAEQAIAYLMYAAKTDPETLKI